MIAGDRIWFQNDPCDVSDFLNMNSCRNGNETFVHGRFLLEILIWKESTQLIDSLLLYIVIDTVSFVKT